MIKERCYFMGGPADGRNVAMPCGVRNIKIPIGFHPFRFVVYTRTKLTHPAPHPIHGEWPLTVYAWTND